MTCRHSKTRVLVEGHLQQLLHGVAGLNAAVLSCKTHAGRNSRFSFPERKSEPPKPQKPRSPTAQAPISTPEQRL